MKFLKNILIVAIISGLLAPSIQPALALSDKGLIGGLIGTEPAKTAADKTELGTLQETVVVMEDLIPLCTGVIAGLASGPTGSLGICQIEIVKAQGKVFKKTDEIAQKRLTYLEKILDFLDILAYQLFKRVILDRLVDALIKWIQNDGKGSIIGDWGQFFDDAANIAAGEFVRGIGAGFLCSPFNLHIQLTLLPVDRFSKVSCTLDQIIGNINSFFDDFRNGSWIAYQEQWYPRNNFYGGTLIAMEELHTAEFKARDAAKTEAQANNGFLSWTVEECVANPTGSYKDSGCSKFAPAGYTGEDRYAKIKTIKTPGSVTAGTATEIAGKLQLTRLIHSEDLTAYITAILDASINTLTKKGIKWLANAASRNTPPRISPQFPCAGLTGEAFSACQSSVNAERIAFNGSQVGINNAVAGSLSIRGQVTNVLQESINLQTEYVHALGLLVSSGLGDDREQELTEEEELLEDLIARQESNFSFIEVISDQLIEPEELEAGTAVTEQDYLDLRSSINTDYVGDEVDATELLLESENQLQEIKNKVESNLPTILILLPPNLRPNGKNSATQ